MLVSGVPHLQRPGPRQPAALYVTGRLGDRVTEPGQCPRSPHRRARLPLSRALLTAALGFPQLREEPPEVKMLRQWLDTWSGLGAVVDGMRRLGYDLALTHHANTPLGWRALVLSGWLPSRQQVRRCPVPDA